MIRRAMEVGDWRLRMVLGCSGEAVERLCTGIEVYLGFGHDDTIEAVISLNSSLQWLGRYEYE